MSREGLLSVVAPDGWRYGFREDLGLWVGMPPSGDVVYGLKAAMPYRLRLRREAREIMRRAERAAVDWSRVPVEMRVR